MSREADSKYVACKVGESVSNGSRQSACGPGLHLINGSVQFWNCQKI